MGFSHSNTLHPTQAGSDKTKSRHNEGRKEGAKTEPGGRGGAARVDVKHGSSRGRRLCPSVWRVAVPYFMT